MVLPEFICLGQNIIYMCVSGFRSEKNRCGPPVGIKILFQYIMCIFDFSAIFPSIFDSILLILHNKMHGVGKNPR